ncbi:MAG TPA: GDSL-type esterase/lipase family protein [Ferruginibacter sp.]|nr:GDSL-type esterase/lipase family protein [Ferruginibacter sp.]
MPTYLALGDSYTIGEQVEPAVSFPYQLVQLLREQGIKFYAPEILAKTGWTTEELSAAIEKAPLLARYDVVSLLIGVNDQYRGRSVNDFRTGFDHLLQKSIELSGNCPGNVFVLSIPDWGITPFAGSRDREKISREINAFNIICKQDTTGAGAIFIDITQSQRLDGHKTEFLAPDGLHPSAIEYTKWAEILVKKISSNNK